jgi:predicted DsbA family dithiol-disulfide isomerase
VATLTVYYDYTCHYSYRAMHWMDLLRAARPDLDVHWATFSLKETNRSAEEPSYLEPDSPPSVSVLAQALAHAAREADFDAYHRTVFESMQGQDRHLGETDLLAIAATAGVDEAAFAAERGRWISSVGAEHRDAVAKWGVYGTPTLILDGAAAFVRLREVPGSESDAVGLLDSLAGIAISAADLAEIFRPEGPKPTPIPIEKIGKDS